MEDSLEHRAIKWILAIIVFIASFHATWLALNYINGAPKPTPNVERKLAVPSQDDPGVLI